jgi:hypothetical protein
MLRQWAKIILMALLMLMQTACPKFLMQQNNNDVRVHPYDDTGGSNSGSG